MGLIAELRYKALYKIYTSNMLPLVPGSSDKFGPPRRTTTSQEFARSGGGKWIETFPAQDRNLAPAIVSWGENPNLESKVASKHHAQGVLIVDQARLRSEHGYPIVSGDKVVTDATFIFENRKLDPLYKNWKIKPVKRLPGTTLNLMSYLGSSNYAHAMLDALPRIAIFLKAGLTFADVDTIIVPNFKSEDFALLVSRLNIPSEKVKYLQEDDHWICDTLIQPNFPGVKVEAADWVPNFYRELLQLPSSPQTRLIYVPRRGFQRNLTNDAEVTALLQERGFTEVVTEDPMERFIQFSEAKAVVGPHGAGLGNIAFCQPGTEILEFMPSDHQFPFWYALSHAAKLRYHVLIGESVEKRKSAKELATFSDFTLPIEGLKASLAAMNL